jgi:2-isopropylmalate synthase
MRVAIYDTTLRDGTQREGISLSVADKLKIARLLDHLGVAYIEGGWPGSNPKDAAFFEAIQSVELKHARIAAFGSTCRKNTDSSRYSCRQDFDVARYGCLTNNC